ncbi:MAG: RluA family pseudouridine synthase [Gammaproteobacteria bacterium]|nr:RluA family pseudouridine synthase [Gammaproteobacteria bacterium]
MKNPASPESLPASECRGVEFIEVSTDADNQRVDNFLLGRLKGVPKSRIYRLIRKGEVRVNKKRVKPESRLHAGDNVRVPPIRVADAAPPVRPGSSLVKLIKDSIIFEDAELIVINKPQGIAVHGGSGLKTGLIESMRWILQEAGQGGEFLELAHRIDRETTGCLVIAKTPRMLKHLHNELKAKRVTKSYHALVHGRWPDDVVQVNAPLRKNEVKAGEKVVVVDPEGKPSVTNFRILKRFSNATLIEASPLTGRTHQIRVHCQYAGHPIVGDQKYTSTTRDQFSDTKILCLHAAMISFNRPESDQRFSTNAPVNPMMLQLLDSLR